MIEEIAIAAMVGITAYATRVAVTYSRTSHGPNPWTVDALLNAIRTAIYFERCISLISGSLNDAYRCNEVNKAVGGVATSYHQRGLAIDIHPGGSWTPETGARKMYAAALAAQLGPVRTVIWEPTWVHVDYHDPNDTAPQGRPNFLKKTPTGYEAVKP